VKVGDSWQSGLLIKLCDGCMISWDGLLLCHCTSVWKSSPNEFRSSNISPTVGTFVSFHMAHNGPTLSKMWDIRKLQYREYMSDNASSEQLQLFAEKVADGDIPDFW